MFKKYEDWADDQDIVFETVVKLNDQVVGRLESHSTDSLAEELYKLDDSVSKALEEDWDFVMEDYRDESE